MTVIKAALLGFGTVGKGVYDAVQTHRQELKTLLGAEVEIAGVLIKDVKKERNIEKHVLVTDCFDDILQIPGLDVVFEAIVGEEPGFSYLQRAMEQGCDVVTANKVMFAKHGAQLLDIAREYGVKVGYEATVAGGVPIIRTIAQQLQVNKIGRIQAILNGTSNYILTEMRKRDSEFQEVLQQAQELGYAEADPANDVEGNDAFCKLMILSQLAFGSQPEWKNVQVEGISRITLEQVQAAKEKGLRYKHVAEAIKEGDEIRASVRPVLTSANHPLYSIEGVDNAIVIESSLAGTVTVQGPGAGSGPTASAMLEDMAHIFQGASATHPEKNRKKAAAYA